MAADVRVKTPNNLGATLLIMIGIGTSPIGVGMILLLVGIAALRDHAGEISFPQLRCMMLMDHIVQFWRKMRL